jgi:hypothetical protein
MIFSITNTIDKILHIRHRTRLVICIKQKMNRHMMHRSIIVWIIFTTDFWLIFFIFVHIYFAYHLISCLYFQIHDNSKVKPMTDVSIYIYTENQVFCFVRAIYSDYFSYDKKKLSVIKQDTFFLFWFTHVL